MTYISLKPSTMHWFRQVIACSQKLPWLTFVGLELLLNFCFLSHNFAPDMLEPSEESDDSLVSKKTWAEKLACWLGAQGQFTSAKKVQKHAPIITSTTRNTTPKTKNKKKSKVEDLQNPQMVWTAL